MILDDAWMEDGLRVYAIGDVHGCVDQLRSLINMIDEEIDTAPDLNGKLVFLGDYVDRGPANRDVIQFLMELEASGRDCVFLRGNHDERFVSFVEHPKIVGDSFLMWGGLETLRDYGISFSSITSLPIEEVSRKFANAVPEAHLDFMKCLIDSVSFGDYFFCHAGIRPGVALERQAQHDLMWIRDDFLHHEQPFEKVIVHGHTPGITPEVKPNRINIDTRCYESGILTALVLEGARHRFIQTKN